MRSTRRSLMTLSSCLAFHLRELERVVLEEVGHQERPHRLVAARRPALLKLQERRLRQSPQGLRVHRRILPGEELKQFDRLAALLGDLRGAVDEVEILAAALFLFEVADGDDRDRRLRRQNQKQMRSSLLRRKAADAAVESAAAVASAPASSATTALIVNQEAVGQERIRAHRSADCRRGLFHGSRRCPRSARRRVPVRRRRRCYRRPSALPGS